MCSEVKDITAFNRNAPIKKIEISNPIIKNAYLAVMDESMYYPIVGDPKKHDVKKIISSTLSFRPVNEIAVSMSFFLIIDTEDLKDNFIEASIIDDQDEVLFKEKLNLYTSKKESRKLYGSYYGKDEKGKRKVLWQKATIKLFDSISNKDTFNNTIIKRITLPMNPRSAPGLREKISKLENKSLNILLKIDAYSPNKKYKGKEDRIKYLGVRDPRDKDKEEFNNYFIADSKNYFKLKAWRGIVVHSMGDEIITKEGKVKHKDFIKSVGLSVHGYVRENGDFESHQNLFNKAFHAGESYHQGISGMNETYLGFELTVNEATNLEKLEIICDTPNEVKSSEVEKL